MASNISVAATLPVKHHKTSTKEMRLAALTLAEAEERKALAEPYTRLVPKGHYLQPKPQRHLANPYLQFFHSEEGDAETTESLLPPVAETRQSSSGKRSSAALRHAGWRDKSLAEEKVRMTLPTGSRAVSPSSFNGHLLDDGPEEELTYSPKSRLSLSQSTNANRATTRRRAPTLSPSTAAVPTTTVEEMSSHRHQQGDAQQPSTSTSNHQQTPPATASSSTYLDRARLRAHRPRNSEAQVDLLSLNPATAEAYVKYEKLYRMMVAEDTEFFAFRRQYFKKLNKGKP